MCSNKIPVDVLYVQPRAYQIDCVREAEMTVGALHGYLPAGYLTMFGYQPALRFGP